MELQLSRAGRRYGAHFSEPNANENGFPAHLVQRVGVFPPRACITGVLAAERKDQLTVGCCAGESSANLGQRLYRRYKNQSPIFDPLFLYYLGRKSEKTLAQGDCGMQVVTGLIVPDCNPGDGGYGWAPETAPFDPKNVDVVPTTAQLYAAKAFPGGAVHNVGNIIANIKSCILSDYSGVIGILVCESFEDDSTTNTGLIPLPNREVEESLGRHAMHSLLGYDDSIRCPNSPNPGAVLTENSWGNQWGCECPFPSLASGRGFGWLSYDYLMNPALTGDVRMAHLGAPWA